MKQVVVEMIRTALAADIPMLVLRGVDEHARPGGDVDVLVPSRHAVRACQRLAATARAAGWYLAAFRDIGYLAQVVLVRPGLGGADEAIKVDFFSGFEWYGVGSDGTSRRFFDALKMAEGSSDQEQKLSAAVTFFQKCLICGQLNERDWARVLSGGATPIFLRELAETLGLPITASDIAHKGVAGWRQWRLRRASSGTDGAFSTLLWFSRVTVAHLRFKLGVGTGAGHLIGLSGLDGSGKSTQIERLFAAYKQAGGIPPRLVHLLPAWIPMPHQLLLRKQTIRNYTRPYAEAPVTSKWSGRLRLAYYLAAFTAAKCSLRIATLRGRLVILDRSFVDFSADLTRARIPESSLPAWLIRLGAPKGSLLFLDASPEVVVRRKGELQLAKAADLRQRYLEIIKQIDGLVIDGEATPDDVFKNILEKVDSITTESLARKQNNNFQG